MTEKHSTVNIDYKNINVKIRERATDYNVYNKESYKYNMCTTNTVGLTSLHNILYNNSGLLFALQFSL